MADSSKAVFLSYASQDAEAVRRIADALRAAGVEVWFDQNELVGGDAWDAKIRGQIAACALFVPIISANTQARLEGYFRIEWKLAAQRTHAMAEAKPFLVPIVIDATRDAEAHVPGEFKAVQWTRLRQAYGGQGRQGPTDSDRLAPEDADLAAFGVRVKKLLGSEGAPASSRPSEHNAGRMPTLPPIGGRRVPTAAWAAGALTIVGLVAFLALRKAEPAAGPDRAMARVLPGGESRPSASAVSPAREWVSKARALFEPWDLATHDDFKQAEQFLNRAIELDPSDGEAWTSRAILSCGFYVMHGGGAALRNQARSDAERAIKLAPASDYARVARAYAMRLDRDTEAEGIQSLRELVVRLPKDRFVLRILGAPLSRRAETAKEGLDLLVRAAAQSGGDPIADYIQGESLIRYLEREAEGLAAIDRALALAPNYADAHAEKIFTLLDRRGDLEAARTALAQVPTALLREERVIAVAVKVWLAANEPERALRALAPASAQLTATYFKGPTGYLKGMAYRRAGRLPAAQTEWRLALRDVQRRLEAAPTDPIELLWKACLLALLGERAEAHAVWDLARQFTAAQTAATAAVGAAVRSILVPEETFAGLSRIMSSNNRGRWQTAARILFDPAFDHLRDEPSFTVLVEQAKAFYAEKKNSETKKR